MNEPTTALVPTKQTNHRPAEPLSVFGSVGHFEVAQRMAKALSTSQMVPESYRGEQNIGSCLIALEMANRIGANVLSVTQNLYIVHGKPAWSSQFLIACVNASGKFSPLRYTMTGTKGDDTQGCIAWAMDKSNERLEGPEVTIGMAKAEGWFQKNGSKWKTMPELMLRYRAATLFSRLYAPELSLGLHTEDEVVDVVEVAPVVTEGKPQFVTAPTPAAEKKARKAKEQAPVDVTATKEPEPATAEPANPAPVAETTPEPEKADTFESIVDGVAEQEAQAAQETLTPVAKLRQEMTAKGIVDSQVVKFFNLNKGADRAEIATLDNMPVSSVSLMTKHIAQNGAIAKKIREIVP